MGHSLRLSGIQRPICGALIVGVAVLFAASCSSAHSDETTPASHRLAFREVVKSFPCGTGSVLSPSTVTPVVGLFDRKKETCYELGPTLLTGEDVASAVAVLNRNAAQWEVDVQFANDDFVNKVATPEVGRTIAIVLDDVVLSAPRINPGIVGRDVTISGEFDKEGARSVAKAIAPPGTAIDVPTSATTPVEAVFDVYSKRCTTVVGRLGFDTTLVGGSSITLATARSAFARAHQPFPDQLAHIDDDKRLALCSFMPAARAGSATPTTRCAHGEVVGLPAEYTVDEHLTATKLPGIRYLVPEGADPNFDVCGPLSSP